MYVRFNKSAKNGIFGKYSKWKKRIKNTTWSANSLTITADIIHILVVLEACIGWFLAVVSTLQTMRLVAVVTVGNNGLSLSNFSTTDPVSKWLISYGARNRRSRYFFNRNRRHTIACRQPIYWSYLRKWMKFLVSNLIQEEGGRVDILIMPRVPQSREKNDKRKITCLIVFQMQMVKRTWQISSTSCWFY